MIRAIFVNSIIVVLFTMRGVAQTPCSPIMFGQSIPESITNAGEEDCFEFNGEAGQQVTVFLDHQSSVFDDFSLRLTKPGGTSWFCGFDNDDCEIDNVTLTTTGLYTITVDGDGASTGNYTLALNWLNDDSTSISYNQSMSDVISPTGDQDHFIFNGEARQQVTVFLDHQASVFDDFSLRLTKPDGTSWFCGFDNDDCEIDNVTLPTAGLYTITVDGDGASTGNYTLALNWLNDDSTSIAYDQSFTDAISPTGDQDTFIFDGEAGQRINAFLDHQASVFDDFSLRLNTPDGNTLQLCDFTAGDCEIGNVLLPTTGCFTLIVDGAGASTGNYTLSLNLLQGVAEQIAYDQSLSRDISPACDQDSYTFSGETGQRVTVYLQNLSAAPLSLRLIAPDGSIFRFCEFTTEDCQLDNVRLLANGTYTLTVDAEENATGDYTIALSRLDGDTTPVACGQSINEMISPIGDQDRFTFDGRDDHKVLVSLQNQSSGRLSLSLAASDGTILKFCDFTSDSCEIETILSKDDEYTLTVDGEEATNGNYILTLKELDWDVEPKPITYGDSLESEICPTSDEDSFIFDGEVGQRVTASLKNLLFVSLSLRLITPDDSTTLGFCDFTSSDCETDTVTLPKNSKYLVIIEGEENVTGSYRLSLTLHQPVAVASDRENQIPNNYRLGQNYPNPFNPSTQIQYEIAQAGQVIVTVYNSLGQKIKTLENEFHQPGQYQISWDGKDEQGHPSPNGMYLYRLKINSFAQSHKMLLVK